MAVRNSKSRRRVKGKGESHDAELLKLLMQLLSAAALLGLLEGEEEKPHKFDEVLRCVEMRNRVGLRRILDFATFSSRTGRTDGRTQDGKFLKKFSSKD